MILSLTWNHKIIWPFCWSQTYWPFLRGVPFLWFVLKRRGIVRPRAKLLKFLDLAVSVWSLWTWLDSDGVSLYLTRLNPIRRRVLKLFIHIWQQILSHVLPHFGLDLNHRTLLCILDVDVSVMHIDRVVQHKRVFFTPERVLIVWNLRLGRSGQLITVQLSNGLFSWVFVSLLIRPLIMKKLVLIANSLINKERFMLMVLQIFFDTSCPFFSFHLMNFIKPNYFLFSCCSTLGFDSLMVWTCNQINLWGMVPLKTWVHIWFWNLIVLL